MSSKPIGFLDLPAEIRLNIYRYLIPRIRIKYGQKGMRRKWQCAPAMLRTNRAIYHEIAREWYGSVQYGLAITRMGVIFPSYHYIPNTPLPSILPFIKSLDLLLPLFDHEQGLERMKMQDESKQHEWFYPMIVPDCLEAVMNALVGLETLYIRLYMDIPCDKLFRRWPERLPGLIERVLEPIRRKLRKDVELQGHAQFSLMGTRPFDLTGEMHERAALIFREMIPRLREGIQSR